MDPDGTLRLKAGLLAPAAMFGADAAVLMFLGVAFALVSAEHAGLSAGLKRKDDQGFVSPGAAGRKLAGCEAKIGAVQVEPDALAQLRHHFFAQASVRAGNAYRSAGEAFLDAGHQCVVGGRRSSVASGAWTVAPEVGDFRGNPAPWSEFRRD